MQLLLSKNTIFLLTELRAYCFLRIKKMLLLTCTSAIIILKLSGNIIFAKVNEVKGTKY